MYKASTEEYFLTFIERQCSVDLACLHEMQRTSFGCLVLGYVSKDICIASRIGR